MTALWAGLLILIALAVPPLFIGWAIGQSKADDRTRKVCKAVGQGFLICTLGVFLLGLSVVLCGAGVLSASLLRRIVLILPVLLAVVILFTRSRTKHRKKKNAVVLWNDSVFLL